MKWSEDHEVLMLREMMVVEPWSHKKGSIERGEDWEKLAQALNAISNPKFKVTLRSCRDHYVTMEKLHKKKVSQENRATGTAPEEETEAEQLMGEIIELFNESDIASEAKKEKEQEQIKKAEEMRQRSLETFKESSNRNEKDGSESKKRKRSSGSDTMAYLKQKAELDTELKREKLEVKRQELDLQAKDHSERKQQMQHQQTQQQHMQQQMQQQIQLQQQQMQQFMQMNASVMQQQQQQTVAFMELMKKIVDK